MKLHPLHNSLVSAVAALMLFPALALTAPPPPVLEANRPAFIPQAPADQPQIAEHLKGGPEEWKTAIPTPRADTTPDQFNLGGLSGAPLSTVVASNGTQITGIDAPASVSMSGSGGGSEHQYCVHSSFAYPSPTTCDRFDWRSTSDGTVANGEVVWVRHTTPAAYATVTQTTLTVGGVSDTFTSVTVPDPALDSTPDPFAFTDVVDVPLSTLQTSIPVQITGLTTPTTIWAHGYFGSFNEHAVSSGNNCSGDIQGWTSEPGVVNNNQYVCARHTSASGYYSVANTTVTIGSAVSDTFTSRTTATGGTGDTTPYPFFLGSSPGAPLSTEVASYGTQITGIDAPAPISISDNGSGSGHQYCVHSVLTFFWPPTTCDRFDWRSTPDGTVANGEVIWVRHTTPATYATVTQTTLTVGGVSGNFTSVTVPDPALDSTPDPFAFTDVVDVPLSTLQTSIPVQITGLTTPTTIWAHGDFGSEYSISSSNDCLGNVQGWTNEPGVVSNNQYVCVRHISSAVTYTAAHTTLVVIGPSGSVFDTFTSRTTATGGTGDAIPDPFYLGSSPYAPLSTEVASYGTQITGIDAPPSVSVSGSGGGSGHQYCVHSSAYLIPTTCDRFNWRSTPDGTVANGEFVFVRHTTPATDATVTQTTLTVGGVSDTFTSITTGPAGSYYSVGGSVSGLTGTVVLRNNGGNDLSLLANGAFTFTTALANSAAYAVTVLTQPTGQTCTVSSGSGTIALANVTNVAVSCINTYTVGGTTSGLTGTVVLRNNGGNDLTVSANGSFTFTTALANGAAYAVTVLTQPTGQTCTVSSGSGTITVANVTNVAVSCVNSDTSPAQFTFADQTGVARSTVITSAPVQITGINTTTNWTASGGTACVGTNTSNCGCADGSFGANGTTTNNQYLCARHTSSANYSTATGTGVNVGGVSDTFTSTTGAAPPPPPPPASTYSVGGTVSGLDSGKSVVLRNNGGNDLTVTANGGFLFSTTLSNGAAYAVTVLTQPTGQTCTVSNGSGTIASANVTNVAVSCASPIDTTPDPFGFTNQTGVATSTLITSNSITVAGINTAAAISVSGGEYRIGSGSFTNSAGTITNGSTVSVRHTSAPTYSTVTTTTLTIGGVSGSFTSTTLADPNANFTLTVTKTGNGAGLVVSGDSKILCGPSCSTSYRSGTGVALTAIPEVGSGFLGWTAGPCSGAMTNPCIGTMSAATTATANLATAADTGGPRVTATVNGLTSGTFTSPIAVQYTVRQCSELFVLINAPAMGINWSYLNPSGSATTVPAGLTGLPPYRTGLPNGTYTLFSGPVPAGNYELYLACDSTPNGGMDISPSLVFDRLAITVR